MPDVMEVLATAIGARPNATMAELAGAAGMSRATLHRRFPSRELLLAAVAQEAAAAARRALAEARPADGSATQACTRIVAALVPLGGRFAFLLREGAWLDELPDVAAAIAELEGAVADTVARGRHAGEFRIDLPASYQARLVQAAVFTAWEAVAAGELGSAEAPAAAISVLMAGIGSV